jgi:hypothetical protein
MIRVDTRPRHRNSGKADLQRRFPTHLSWLRKRPCLIEGRAGHVCSGRMEASHSDADGSKGMGLKSHDFTAVPLCSAAHAEKDSIGLETWQAKYKVNHAEAGRAYGAKSPHKARWADVAGAPR